MATQSGAAGSAFVSRTERTTNMGTNQKTNRDKIINRNRQAIAGIRKHFAAAATIPLGGKPTAPNDAVAVLQAAIDAVDRAAAAQQALHTAVTAQHAAIAASKVLLIDLRSVVESQLGRTDAVLADFGMTRPKRQVPTEQTKAAAVVKRVATRQARHTMGPRQKAPIKGTVSAGDAKVATGSTSATAANPASPAAPAVGTTNPSR
jgi:hypothetical protein